ncbi:FAD-dependent oxidoreductase [Belliella kenyensis]|uniref:FAD-dependent oxidoreductase n=1 Tax=Belliella kenyensis TaxID=1472724 RepID=A0ABV8ER56_9BACT|nr:glycerol-3-phosphate dehydrogenase/oxidase [Belliella kenyensis]MCH7401990.1 glycerol-3-phosphate dehydrogenase/oxidase [Belliella kenyensis]MDN3605154.1 glycerol-3-phosphate dehydrogenase/oxidase [Belliella kenyensis]
MKFDRSLAIEQIKKKLNWDVIIIGGGATGLGVAVDAASRGFKTLLLESHDFAKGTSSRSTKLVHGGVRYMANGDISLVREALKERGVLAKNAAHLFKNQKFVIPNYTWWGGMYYKFGLSIYDFLSGKLSLGKTSYISKSKTIEAIPTINQDKLSSGVVYYDGQFDDARLALNLAQTAVEQGAYVVNYFPVTGFQKDKTGKVVGVKATDMEKGEEFILNTKTVVNATGVFTNDVMSMDEPDAGKMIVPSQGIHLVLDRKFLPSEQALMIPKTSDGRVLFAVPWHNKVIVGTTDTLIDSTSYEPKPLNEEIDFILETARRFLTIPPTKEDVRSVFSGLRPLAAPSDKNQKTKEISRSHKIVMSESGILTMIGGKWTTYRKMAEDIIDKLISLKKLPPKPCKSEEIAIHGNEKSTDIDFNNPYYVYGSDLKHIEDLRLTDERFQQKIHPNYDYCMETVVFAVQNEMALHVEDVLARRTRLLFLDAKAAKDSALKVAEMMAELLHKDQQWIDREVDNFSKLADGYILTK